MKQSKRARTAARRVAWRATIARLVWGLLVFYEAMDEKLDD